MESYRRLLVAARHKFLCPLQEAPLVICKCKVPWVRACFSGALQGVAALPRCPRHCLLLSFSSRLSRGQKAPQCFKVNKCVYFQFLNLVLKISQRKNCQIVKGFVELRVVLLSWAELALAGREDFRRSWFNMGLESLVVLLSPLKPTFRLEILRKDQHCSLLGSVFSHLSLYTSPMTVLFAEWLLKMGNPPKTHNISFYKF